MDDKQTLVVNLYSGPGALKTTTSAGVFTLLKLHGIDCEMPHEFAKDLVWDNNTESLHDQNFIFGNQLHRLWRLVNKVPIVIVDSPLLFSIVYRTDELEKEFVDNVVATHNKFNNLNFYIERNLDVAYNTNGRMQNLSDAIKIDGDVKKVLLKYDNNFTTIKASFNAVNKITENILKILNVPIKYSIQK